MGRLAVIILAFSAVIYSAGGLTEEIENMINLQQNIEDVIGDQ
jgi:hypothetical protein